MLSLDKPTMDKKSIADDLELRAKNRTISKLKRQGDQYRGFNKEIHYLMEPTLHKDTIVNNLRQNVKDANPQLIQVDTCTKDKISMINRGLVF